jgi:hypothetical protein
MGAVRKANAKQPADESAYMGVAHSVRGFVWQERLSAEQRTIALAISQRHGVSDLIGRCSRPVASASTTWLCSSIPRSRR